MPPDSSSSLQGRGIPLWLIMLAVLTAFGSLSIDMYLPSFSTIAHEFGVGINMVQLTLASFLVGLALGQMFYGPLSDRYGRKPPLYFGIGIYVVVSAACVFVHSIESLIVLRFFQGLGACAGIIIPRAAIRDKMGAAGSARAFSLLMLVFGLAPILAPFFGGLALQAWGWRSIFVILTVFGAGCLIAMHFIMEETLDRHQAKPLQLGRTLRQYLDLLRHPQFIAYAVNGGLMQAAMFAYIAGAPFVLIELHGIAPEHFGYVFGANAVGLIIFSQVNARLVRKHPLDYLLKRALWVAAGVTATMAVLIAAGADSLAVVLIGFFGFTCSYGCISPNVAAIALSEQGQQAGTASALMGTLQFGMSVLAGVGISIWHDGTALPLAIMMAVCTVGGLCLYLGVARRHGLKASS
ncbi:Bcr/CflA family multidrug efflux MFS transporter [Herbaspirillum sp. RTI4]|uniref:Bcr/CflA family multidrug efflux MFS transporter n=1 Tax=Herbaspirillum sp. RTI4 TaxID=3048640 RepID=UPI002AB40BBD|nr:Bcr/CflA family multidrug efflux MFS transporter [Herbaspirillum sp. RTI4]MDY7577411.1 Bcr/CflA family multidrug efflux MFS transporter [Herbaspirillum sp. RTI4]MEA9981687.1 Bcr/CflA family multidrug efflux MFS transporter [Herbaspirillum sp. RTI4]